MFRTLAILAVFPILIFLAPVAKADEIYLKDGNILRVEHCEEKDGMVVFNLKGSGQLYSMDTTLVKKLKCSPSAPKKYEKKSDK